MNSREQILSRKRTNPICNFKIVKLIIDMIVNSTVNNKQLNTLFWALCKHIVLGTLFCFTVAYNQRVHTDGIGPNSQSFLVDPSHVQVLMLGVGEGVPCTHGQQACYQQHLINHTEE